MCSRLVAVLVVMVADLVVTAGVPVVARMDLWLVMLWCRARLVGIIFKLKVI